MALNGNATLPSPYGKGTLGLSGAASNCSSGVQDITGSGIAGAGSHLAGLPGLCGTQVVALAQEDPTGPGSLDGGGKCTPRKGKKCPDSTCPKDEGREYRIDEDCNLTWSACDQKYCVADDGISSIVLG